MRYYLSIMLTMLFLFMGCAVKTQTFETESSPSINMTQVYADLNALFTYCNHRSDSAPDIVPAEDSTHDPARLYELADTIREKELETQDYQKQGCLGENNRGYLELQQCDALKDPENKNDAQKILAAVNKERKSLYYELALFYHHSDLPVGVIEDLAANYHIENANTGDWLQLPPVGARFDKFIKSPLGKELGDLAKASQWIQYP